MAEQQCSTAVQHHAPPEITIHQQEPVMNSAAVVHSGVIAVAVAVAVLVLVVLVVLLY